jgi:hypothetical protein
VGAQNQISFMYLMPPGVLVGYAAAVADGQQVGAVGNPAGEGYLYRACIWSNTAASYCDLNPPLASESEAFACFGGRQAGYARFNGASHAGMWSGTASSFEDLHPAGATHSRISDISQNLQCGYAVVGIYGHAGFWSGSALSFVDLHPTNASSSQASGVDGDSIVGDAEIGGSRHAALWSGSTHSFVDLHPSGATRSILFAVAGGLQAGLATFAGKDVAGIWSGTSASFVVMNPTNATRSGINAAVVGIQAGYARIGGQDHAGIWFGTPGSFVDLHSVLGPEYPESHAYGIKVSADEIFVTGEVVTTNYYFRAATWTVTQQPRLEIRFDTSNALLRWPTNAVGFNLQQAIELFPNTAWNPVTNEVLVFNSWFNVTIPIEPGGSFFRLAKP